MLKLNKIQLTGRLVNDPTTKEIGDKTVTNARIACDRIGDNDDTDFINLTLWNGKGKALATHAKKGAPIFVEGRLQIDQTDQGIFAKVVVSDWQFLEPKKEEAK